MTFEEALKRIGLLTGWRIVEGAGGRECVRDEGGRCPLEALAGTGPFTLLEAAGRLELEVGEMTRIAAAADDDPEAPPADRHSILVACGLAATEQGR